MADGTNGKQRINNSFRGVYVNDEVHHIWDKNAKGRVQAIQIPLVYVKFQGDEKVRCMDRDELVVLTKKEEDLPDFEPEFVPEEVRA